MIRGISASALLALALPILANFQQPPGKSQHEKATESAWLAFKQERWDEVLTHAERCLSDFRGTALRMERELGDKAKYPTGPVTAEQKQVILANGPLNDVAVCTYLRARALDQLGRRKERDEALAEAMRYTNARIWDSRGWMWSPATAADRYRTRPDLADANLHSIYTADAWAAFNRAEYLTAQAIAGRCVEEFLPAARDLEASLQRRGVRITEGVVNRDDHKLIEQQGILNDVGTCYFIQGRAAEARGDWKTAATAYRAAILLPRARCFDSAGWWWGTAKASSDRLELIR